MAAKFRDIKVADYRERAAQAAALAESSNLAHVREKHARAAATWSDLADIEERVAAGAEKREAEAEARAEAQADAQAEAL